MGRNMSFNMLPQPEDHAELTRTLSEVKTLLSDIEIGPKIGAGTFGQVFKGRLNGHQK